jgi:hypothetical protein
VSDLDRRPRPSRLVLVVGGIVVLVLVAAGVIALFLAQDDERESVGPTGDRGAALAPTAFAGQARPFSVTLSWAPPDGDVEGFVLYRDGTELSDLDAQTTSFVDDGVLPDVGYVYAVEAVGEGWAERAEPIEVRTPAAPLASARLEGLYAIEARDVSHFGFRRFPGEFTSGWRLEPRCPEGACDVRWRDVRTRGLAGELRRRGATYDGSDEVRLARCGGARTTSTVRVEFEVARAASVDGAWRAIRLRGTLIQRSPAQLGCVASGADYRVIATLIE